MKKNWVLSKAEKELESSILASEKGYNLKITLLLKVLQDHPLDEEDSTLADLLNCIDAMKLASDSIIQVCSKRSQYELTLDLLKICNLIQVTAFLTLLSNFESYELAYNQFIDNFKANPHRYRAIDIDLKSQSPDEKGLTAYFFLPLQRADAYAKFAADSTCSDSSTMLRLVKILKEIKLDVVKYANAKPPNVYPCTSSAAKICTFWGAPPPPPPPPKPIVIVRPLAPPVPPSIYVDTEFTLINLDSDEEVVESENNSISDVETDIDENESLGSSR